MSAARTTSLLAAIIISVSCLVSCAKIIAATQSPYRITAWRAPASAPGAQCAARCLSRFQSCQNGVAAADRCNGAAADCMNSCPGVTQAEAPAESPFNDLVARKTCDQNLSEPKYCFVMDFADTTQWGVVYQPDYSAAQGQPASGPPATFKEGQAVLARYKGDKFWFAARVRAIEGSAVAIIYLDGSTEILRAQHVKPFDWNVGTAIECNWKRKGKYYAGKITAVSGQTGVHVNYDDGDQEDTDIAECRSRG